MDVMLKNLPESEMVEKPTKILKLPFSKKMMQKIKRLLNLNLKCHR